MIQSSGNKLALSLICTRENVTVELEADYAGYSVRPKMMVLISAVLFIMALNFFYFSALRTRYIAFRQRKQQTMFDYVQKDP